MKSQYDDPHLVEIYDQDNPDGPDHEFFRQLAQDTHAKSIIDLGCGTGILTVTLAGPERSVVGIDPASAMLEYAARRPGGNRVQWAQGTSALIQPASADLIIMSGNVAMHIIGESWHQALRQIAKGLKPGGRLAFEVRNPEARAWEQWSQDKQTRATVMGRVQESTLIEPPDQQGIITMRSHYEFLDAGYRTETVQRLHWRSYDQIVDDLEQASLHLESCYSWWNREPFKGGADQPLMIFCAQH